MNLRYRISQFMYGRYASYGIDLLTKVLAVFCIILSVLNLFVGSFLIYITETALFFYMFYRLFSRNIYKRQDENRNFTGIFGKIKDSFNFHRRRHSERHTHIYKKCPHCSVMLRLPRRSGEHTVCCPRCKNNFKVKVR
ncbi:MAG: hypothetical protein J6Q56_03945 [Clostridia bacterium]|nr:hypothetical protein [Clostridia bacterium]